MQKVKIKNIQKELEWKGEGSSHHAEVDGIEFNGHVVLWRFEYVPETYLKESELSGDEWRKGGYSRIYMNDVCVWESFCRKADKAIFQISGVLYELMDFHNWDSLKPGYKLYYMETPAVIDRVLDNGELIVKIEDETKEFPLWGYQQEDLKEEGFVDRDWAKVSKVHVLDPRLWWWRK